LSYAVKADVTTFTNHKDSLISEQRKKIGD